MNASEKAVALVTGASRGIGRAVALRLASDGFAVIVNYRSDRTGAEQTVAEIRSHGGTAGAICADVAERSAVDAMVSSFAAKHGPISVLVNNAGAAAYGSALSMTDDDLDNMMAVNVKGALHCAQAVAPQMIDQHYGRIINVSSVAALSTAAQDVSAYAMSKASVNMLTKRLALELGPHAITVNAVCPGPTNTEMLAAGKDNLDIDLKTVNILGRMAEPAEIAAVIAFLASRDASFVTAQAIAVDGGVMRFLSRSD